MKLKHYIFILSLCCLAACASLETVSLSEEQPLAQQDSVILNAPCKPILEVKGGLLYNKDSDIGLWEASHGNIVLGKSGESLVIDLTNVGADWEQVLRRFPKPLDFSAAPFIMVKARLDVKSPDSLKLRIDLVDDEGLSTNYSPQEKYIRAKPDSKTYKFIYAGNWVQNWPVKADVDSRRIAGVRINFNGGGPNYSGKLIIDEIRVSNGIKKVENPMNYALFDFTDGVTGWWSANSISVTSEDLDGKDIMKLNIDESGPGWEGFGNRLDRAINLAQTPVMMVLLKANKAGKLRIDLKDNKEYSTNYAPLLIDFEASDSYQKLFFNYTDKFKQIWPVSQTVDSTQIASLACYVNPPPDNPAYTGTVIIDDIQLLSIEEYNKIK